MIGPSDTTARAWPIPALAGIGLRAPHARELLESLPELGWLEVHSENYFGHGIPLDHLLAARRYYPVSLHGVGLSVGSTDPLDLRHLDRLKALIERVGPVFVSEHLSWSSVGGRHLNDLLPLPYTEEALSHLVARVGEVQDRLGRRLLIENISSYLQMADSSMPEWEFLAELARRSGCGVLLDVNNVYVSACNHGFDPHTYLAGIPVGVVEEMHLAGFTRKRVGEREILIDTHDRPVHPEVWALYRAAVRRFGPTPTLVEWDADLPLLGVLVEEAARARSILEIADADAEAA